MEYDPDHVEQYERETWGRCAENYLEGFAGLTRETLPFVIEAAGVESDTRVLEIGSGPGHIADALRRGGATVTGIDFSAPMVEVARRSYPSIDFHVGDAEELPFEEDSFDAVVCNFVVHHLARPEVVFRQIRRVLTPGGRFAFTVFADPAAQSSIGAIFQAVEEHHTLEDLPHGPLFGVTDLDLYASLLDAGGLIEPAFEFRPITWHTSSLDPVLQAFWSWGNLDALSPELQRKIEECARESLSAFRAEEGFDLPHEVLLGRAGRAP